MLNHLWRDSIHFLDCMEDGRCPFNNLDFFIDCHSVDVLSCVEMQGGFGLVEDRLHLLRHFTQSACLLIGIRVRSCVIVHTESSCEWIVIIQIHPLVSRLHELGDSLICKIINHLDFNLLENLRALLQTFSSGLRLEFLLGRLHIDLLDRILGLLCRDNQPVSVVGRAARTQSIVRRERGDALQYDVYELNIERACQN